jgi:hypothetical protein
MGRPLLIYWSLAGPDDSGEDGAAPAATSLVDTLLRWPGRLRFGRMLRMVH